MFQVELQQLGKRFNREVIFKDLDYTFFQGKFYAITGSNGSGKSTLLQIISGFLLPSKGTVHYSSEEQVVEAEKVYRHLSLATPYMELIEDFTLYELFDFHFKFRDPRPGYPVDKIIDTAYLTPARDKYVKNFSSGMKQRTKLALALFSASDIVLLDEPTTNLDKQGIRWYRDLLEELNSPLVIVASNQEEEYEGCDEVINIENYK